MSSMEKPRKMNRMGHASLAKLRAFDQPKNESQSLFTKDDISKNTFGDSNAFLPNLDDKFINHPTRKIPSKTEKHLKSKPRPGSQQVDMLGNSTDDQSDLNPMIGDIKTIRNNEISIQQSRYINKVQSMLTKAPFNEYSNTNLKKIQQQQQRQFDRI